MFHFVFGCVIYLLGFLYLLVQNTLIQLSKKLLEVYVCVLLFK